ncbi:MAG: hypothetical protein R6V19_14905 [Armatimonadota bacterium]
MNRYMAVTLVLVACVAASSAATVGYVEYAGIDNPAVDDSDPWVQALRDGGHTVELVTTTQLPDAQRMADFSALYMNGVTALTNTEFSALQRYVRSGGFLLMQGAANATALDKSGQHRLVKGEYAWKIIYLQDGACRTGLLPATGAGSNTRSLTIDRIRITDGLQVTAGTQTSTVLQMPQAPGDKSYTCATLYYFPATGVRPVLWGLPAAEDDEHPEPVALAVYNEYGTGRTFWTTCPLAQMAADGVDFAETIVANVLATISNNASPDPAELRRLLPTIDEVNEDLKAYDTAFRGGKGYSDSADSGELGWGEASRLLMYVKAWEVCRDEYWLDQIVDHFDRMIENLSDPDEDGYLGWQTITYTDALAWPRPGEDNVGQARIGPRLVRARANTDVTGHTYLIRFIEPDAFEVIDANTLDFVKTSLPYKSGEPIEAIPGIKVTITGQPVKGDEFQVRTQAVKPTEWVVHDGTITYPIALFIELVKNDPPLAEKYGEKADEYADLLLDNFLKKWDHVWVEIPPDMGVYEFEPRLSDPYLRQFPPEQFPDVRRILPHNQYLALGRTFAVMANVVEGPRAEDLRERAAKMGRFFKSKLRQTGKAYTFAYADEIEGVSDGADDFSHGGLSLSFAIEAYERGLVFDDADIERFSHTLLDQIWNGSLEDPKFSKRVNGDGERQVDVTNSWADLSAHNDEVWRLFWTILRQQPESHAFLTLWHARPEIPEE